MPSTAIRQQILKHARRLVVKVGSQVLADAKGQLDPRHMKALAEQIAALIERGYDMTLVSSGAIAVGRKMLGIGRRPKDVGVLQAVAAVGQTGLMDLWAEQFESHGVRVAQMLLTRGDFEDRKRYLNIRNCIAELHKLKALPIINENDTVAVDEIRFGDNDVLAALVSTALAADALVLLSVVDGVHDADGKLMERVEDAGAARTLVQKSMSDLGSGGMSTKLEAARLVTEAGEVAVIAGGRQENVLVRLMAGERVGTVFVPGQRKLASRLRWIGQAARPSGAITVDEGAAKALAGRDKSLLATGITAVSGAFAKGDVVMVRDAGGREIARGLSNYSADEVRLIMGRRTSEFEKILGRRAYDEVIHRDNLVVVQK